MADPLTYVLTTVSEDGTDPREEVDTFTFPRRPIPVGKLLDPGTEEVIGFACWHAERLGQEVAVRMHGAGWAASFTAYPDRSVYRHATGSKAGFIRGPRA